ncbi:MAG: type II toxin-antitoxin system prevent-host-death family antitoxin [Pseudohongiella sp.]|nr:type II toxin-antitoxin system prevent-host-death family antitoxin [Pseudohongiella sp.]
MRETSVREVREKLSTLLDAVAAGDEVLILRNGKPAARLTAPVLQRVQFADRSELRAALPSTGSTAADLVRALRDEERY